MNLNSYLSVPALAVALTLSACSSFAAPPLADEHAGGGASSAASPLIYAFSPDKSLVASYSAGDRGRTRPISLLEGAQTQLSAGNGMAIDSDGSLYVVVYNATSSSGPLKLLVFAPNAHGDRAPERTAILRGPVLVGHAVGLALDGHGNFWVAAIGKLLRYPTSAKGRVRPNESISLQLDTPDGYMPANSSNVALDASGNIYCSCTVVFHGNQAIGVSEYAPGSRGNATPIRSFYDFALPEVPPGSIAIDGSGTIYLASSLPNTGVFAYASNTGSGSVTYTRRFAWGSGTTISTIATDPTGNVYAGAKSGIAVFGPNANGHVRPLRTMVDARHLAYGTGTYGTLLNVH